MVVVPFHHRAATTQSSFIARVVMEARGACQALSPSASQCNEDGQSTTHKLEQEHYRQAKALNIVYKKALEPDKTFLKLNLAAIHHERAKVFLQFHQLHPDSGYLRDAGNEIRLAWEALTPDLAEWKLYFHLTEARIL